MMVANVVRLPHVTHAGLAAKDPTCRPPLQGVVSPQNVELSAGTKGSIKQRMVQNAFGVVHKSLHTTCPKITHIVLILAPGPQNGLKMGSFHPFVHPKWSRMKFGKMHFLTHF